MNRLREAFDTQAIACESLGSPFMGRLMRLLAADWPSTGRLADRFAAFEGDIGPRGASLPLRIAGGLHALVLSGQDPALAAVYPPHEPEDAALRAAVLDALSRHAAFLDQFCQNAPQTNEIRRSVAIIPAGRLIAAHFGLPLMLSELGASGGLNLNWDRYCLEVHGKTYGPDHPVLTLSPEWNGPLPPDATPEIVDRRGVDLNPLDPKDAADALRLIAYLWPDQPERIERTRAAIAAHDAPVDKADAVAWLETRLTAQPDGVAHMIYSTIAWQYLPPVAQARGQSLIEAAGAKATADRPLAWFRMEADDHSHDIPGAGLTLRLWPGDIHVDLGRVSFHGVWMRWQGFQSQ